MCQVRRILVVLGSHEPQLTQERGELAGRTIKEGPYFNLVVFAGWNGECDNLLYWAHGSGMPSGQPYEMEQFSSNTNQNATFVDFLLTRERVGSGRVQLYNPRRDEIWLVTSDWHAPRAWSAFAARFDNVGCVFEGKPWVLSPAAKRRYLLEEVPGIISYARQGFLAPWCHNAHMPIIMSEVCNPTWFGQQALVMQCRDREEPVPFAAPSIALPRQIRLVQ